MDDICCICEDMPAFWYDDLSSEFFCDECAWDLRNEIDSSRFMYYYAY